MVQKSRVMIFLNSTLVGFSFTQTVEKNVHNRWLVSCHSVLSFVSCFQVKTSILKVELCNENKDCSSEKVNISLGVLKLPKNKTEDQVSKSFHYTSMVLMRAIGKKPMYSSPIYISFRFSGPSP
jgi:hypothetical protein